MAGRLRLGFQVWGQYVTWPELMQIGREIDELGFDELWSNDHFLPLAAGAEGADRWLGGPVFEGWSTLFGWAGITGRARMGCLVSGAAYRNPGLLVKMATALDHATGGRAVLGLGAGWFEPEHEAFGFDVPAARPAHRPVRRGGGDLPRAARRRGRARDGDWFTTVEARNDPPPIQATAAARDRWERGAADAPDRGRMRGHLERRRRSPSRSRVGAGSSTSTARRSGGDPASIERTAGLAAAAASAPRERRPSRRWRTSSSGRQRMPRPPARGDELAVRRPGGGRRRRAAAIPRRRRERRHVRLPAPVRPPDARGAGRPGPRRALTRHRPLAAVAAGDRDGAASGFAGGAALDAARELDGVGPAERRRVQGRPAAVAWRGRPPRSLATVLAQLGELDPGTVAGPAAASRGGVPRPSASSGSAESAEKMRPVRRDPLRVQGASKAAVRCHRDGPWSRGRARRSRHVPPVTTTARWRAMARRTAGGVVGRGHPSPRSARQRLVEAGKRLVQAPGPDDRRGQDPATSPIGAFSRARRRGVSTVQQGDETRQRADVLVVVADDREQRLGRAAAQEAEVPTRDLPAVDVAVALRQPEQRRSRRSAAGRRPSDGGRAPDERQEVEVAGVRRGGSTGHPVARHEQRPVEARGRCTSRARHRAGCGRRARRAVPRSSAWSGSRSWTWRNAIALPTSRGR